MKKTLTALSAALLCAGAAHAQSSVQVTGLMDMYAGSMRYAGDADKTNMVGSGGLTTSWIGFKGTEDLGGGLKATFALTSFLRADTGTPGRFNGDPFFSRDANIGLTGGFGSVRIGRDLAPNFLPSVVANPFGDSFTFSPLVLHMNVPLFNGSGWGATTPSDTGWSNEIIYTTPDMGGLTANVHYQFGEVAGNSSKKNVGVNALYFNGPLTLTGFYERDQISNPSPNALLGTTQKDWMLGGAYDFSVAKAFASYGQASADGSDVKAKTTQLGASVPLGAGKVLASLAHTKLSSTDLSRKTFTLGYDYDLSKRTDVYAMLMNDRITRQNSGTSVGAGIRHRF
ncbi:MAG: porin [Simplicispira sp.]|nr:porin [Simplicispira sp.]